MKKILFTMLCCTLFVAGCSKAAQEEAVVENTEVVEVAPAADQAVASDVVASTEAVAVEQPAQN